VEVVPDPAMRMRMRMRDGASHPRLDKVNLSRYRRQITRGPLLRRSCPFFCRPLLVTALVFDSCSHRYPTDKKEEERKGFALVFLQLTCLIV
jgi:hypothetical protein